MHKSIIKDTDKKILDNIQDTVIIFNKSNKIIFINKAGIKLFGYKKNELINNNSDILISKKNKDFYCKHVKIVFNKKVASPLLIKPYLYCLKKNGLEIPVEMCFILIDIENQSYICSIIHDISERYELKKIMYIDIITNLPKQTYYYIQLYKFFNLAKQTDISLAVLHISFKDFRKIAMGYEAYISNYFLKASVARLKKCIHKSDFIAHIRDDTFAIITTKFGGARDLIDYAKKIIEYCFKSTKINHLEIISAINVGIAMYPMAGKTINTIISSAELALQQANRIGSNKFYCYTPKIKRDIKRQIRVEHEIRHAIQKHNFSLVYQPIIDILNNNKIFGVEVLLRLNIPEFPRVDPNEFILYAENIDIIIRIGKWVIEKACSKFLKWQKIIPNKINNLRLSINISPLQLKSIKLFTLLQKYIQKLALVKLHENLLLEITENQISKDIISIKILDEIQKLGIGIGLDDFGTGYTTLMNLKQFPISFIKIDKSFINELGNKKNAVIVKSIIDMASNLDIKIIAEGIETKSQYEFLKQNDCQYAQGYYFYKPMPEEELLEILKKER